MAQAFTKEIARNIFYGGSAFFFLLFLALTFDTSGSLPDRDRCDVLDPDTEIGQKIALGKSLWETNNCIGCRPKDGIPGRRSMPQFNFTDEQLDAIAEFLKYASEIDTAGWPPNKEG